MKKNSFHTEDYENFNHLIKALKEKYSNLWYAADCSMPNLGKTTNYFEKKDFEKRMDSLIDNLFLKLKDLSMQKKSPITWRLETQSIINSILNEFTRLNNSEMNVILYSGMPKVTELFIKEAYNFNPNMSTKNICQALRNVWIMNIIQLILNKTPNFTNSIFAYSMLYPYTDNYLDDQTLSLTDKTSINVWFEKCLKAESLSINNEYEKSLVSLVEMIEQQYDRCKYPEVYFSLLTIHKAQAQSIFQQKKTQFPFDLDILDITIEKGGASVLADAYLVSGNLSKEALDFIFGFGVVLQLCDDLQDVLSDYRENHATIFSQNAFRWKLDGLASKLINFTLDAIDNDLYFNSNNNILIKKILKENCITLIINAVLKNSILFSNEYIKIVKQFSSYRYSYMKKLIKKIKKENSSFSKVHPNLSLETILFKALEH